MRTRQLKLIIRLLIAPVCVIALMALVHSKSYTPPNHQNLAKIASWVLDQTADGSEAEFLVILADQANLDRAQAMRAKPEKGGYVREALLNKARATQEPLLRWLQERGIEHRSFYIVNLIWVRGDREVVLALAARPEVLRLEGNPQSRNLAPAQPLSSEPTPSLANPAAIEPGVSFVRAPEVWAMGFIGQGIVVGSADTGVEWDHPALKSHYRGWDGTAAKHDYNWHDSIRSGGGSCGPNSPQPCDDSDHGTHTTGTAVGDDGLGNQIGVAPGAKFIACRNMDQGVGTPARYIECMEFFLAPYPVGGTPAQGDPSKAADVTINSWTCPPSEGCAPETLQLALEAQRSAGIMTVVAADNNGPNCSTVKDPPAIYAASYSVGSFNSSTGEIASSSSRGPVTVDGSNRLKPDITAPGVSVRSSVRGGQYRNFSGTSMATPHVAGAVALLWSARPELRQQIALTERILSEAAVKVSATLCESNGIPNNVYGHGRLDIKAAVDLAAARTVANVSAASYSNSALASESIAAAFGSNLATMDLAAATTPLPTTLAGTRVLVRDSARMERLAPLFFVSSGQVNYQIPPGTTSGAATVTVTSGNGSVSTGIVLIAPVAPGLFAANASGRDVAAAVVLRVKAGGSQQYEPVAQFDAAQNKFVAVPIDLGPETDQVFLVLFGTGIKFRSSLSAVTCQIGGTSSEVLYAGEAPGFVGLDQVNVRLLRSLIGRGEVDVVLVVDSQMANTVRIDIK
jgi:uncharacterized protein (TIGR03437 family)